MRKYRRIVLYYIFKTVHKISSKQEREGSSLREEITLLPYGEDLLCTQRNASQVRVM